MFGRREGRLLFGLPGNPVSALVTFLVLVRPALLRWQGAMEVQLPSRAGVLAETISNPGERRHFVRVQISARDEVFLAGAQASHVLSSLAGANALLDLPAGVTLKAGDPVRVLIGWSD
jgi:molybdopterin molybdotransferase